MPINVNTNTFPVLAPVSSPESPESHEINPLTIDESSSSSAANANTSLPMNISLMSEGTLAATLTDTSSGNVTLHTSMDCTHNSFNPEDL